jgi:bile acid:Na+ symporter, BASS family
MLERFLPLWLCLLSMAAFFWDRVDLPDPFVASRPILSQLFAVTMFAVGWMLPSDEIRQVLRRWPTVLGGTAIQYASMPVLAYLVGRLFCLDQNLMLGFVMIGSVPGAMASNVLTMIARGNVSYSLSLTTLATLLSPIFVPLALVLLAGQQVDFPVAKVSWNLCWMVVLPVVAGHLASRRYPQWESQSRQVGKVVANLAILWIIAVVVALNREKMTNLDLTLIMALLTLNLAGYLAGYFGGGLLRLPAPMRRALTLEVGMQNAGLGTVLALTLFEGREAAAIPTALYTFGCMFTGVLLAKGWALRDGMELEGDEKNS